MIIINKSASGEVEASKNMAEWIQNGFYYNFRIWTVSDLDQKTWFCERNNTCYYHKNVEKTRHNCK